MAIRHWLLALALGLVGCGSDDEGSRYVGGSDDDESIRDIGAWEATVPEFEQEFYVRPPGESYGSGDGSSWTDALSGLPEERVRGARYLFASGEFFDPSLDRVENYVLDDPDQGDAFIGLFKATLDDHGTDEGWDPTWAEEPAELGPLAFVTSRYVVDGQTGSGTEGYGFQVTHRDCELRASDFIASPIFFPWDTETQYLALRHLDIADCGNHDDPNTRSQDAIYNVAGVSHVVLRDSSVHDAWRVLFFMQDAFDVLIENVAFARAGQHEEAGAIALRNARNVVLRRSTITDSQNVFVSLQNTRNVTISANVLARSLEGWDVWSGIFSQQPAQNVVIAGNTFYNLAGLNTGIRFTAEFDGVRVNNNLWAANRTNQIMLNGEHSHNAFWDNQRVDGDEPVDLQPTIEEDSADFLKDDPFVNAEEFDLRLTTPTQPGVSLEDPFVDIDANGDERGQDGTWDRGAFEYEE